MMGILSETNHYTNGEISVMVLFMDCKKIMFSTNSYVPTQM